MKKVTVTKKVVAKKPIIKATMTKKATVKSGANTSKGISLKDANNLVSNFTYKPAKGAKRY